MNTPTFYIRVETLDELLAIGLQRENNMQLHFVHRTDMSKQLVQVPTVTGKQKARKYDHLTRKFKFVEQ